MRIPPKFLKPAMYTELAFFMLGVPLLMWAFLEPRAIMGVIWLMALICYFVSEARMQAPKPAFWHWQAITWAEIRRMMIRFMVCTALLVGAVYLFMPDMLFGFVRTQPQIWLLVMVLYPIFSVVPQEFIFRRHLHTRFAGLMPLPMWVLVSGLGFGYAHIIFGNWVAPALCAVGGIIFAQTYLRTRSMALVCIEHALYGDMIFTIGLGKYFYHGAVSL